MGIHEWENQQGKTLWSALFYSGAAGVIGEAILNGFLGYRSDFNQYRVSPVPDPFQLDIFKTDQFSISRNGKDYIEIRHLKNKSVALESSSDGEMIRFRNKGIYRLKEDT